MGYSISSADQILTALAISRIGLLWVMSWSSNRLQNELTLLFAAIEMLYLSSHSCILIWGNRKLTQAFVSLLWQAGRWLKE
ncbi:taste receptor type 2 member 43-like [Ctenodactylus gundi]